MRLVLIVLLVVLGLSALVTPASINYSKQIDILMSARQADLAEYCYTAGVCVEDKPALDPHFASLRVAMCKKRIVMYEAAQVILPCFANFADYLSSQPLSHMNRAWDGIREFNNGSEASGRAKIYANIVERLEFG